ncbi:hypothetical protein ATANTOWER_026399 [Ataeniobius toweri]|uniref:Uncharacterized protein n=1 Tax=Ataeniobius toweri TaxID=208326 RepID=A0ABU7B3F2_9TELE|nr:hypothetical protein [Ataeniobius toweri]
MSPKEKPGAFIESPVDREAVLLLESQHGVQAPFRLALSEKTACVDRLVQRTICKIDGNKNTWLAGELVPISSSLRTRGEVHPGHQSIAGQHRDTQYQQPCTHPFTPNGN